MRTTGCRRVNHDKSVKVGDWFALGKVSLRAGQAGLIHRANPINFQEVKMPMRVCSVCQVEYPTSQSKGKTCGDDECMRTQASLSATARWNDGYEIALFGKHVYAPLRKNTSAYYRYEAGLAWVAGDKERAEDLEAKATICDAKSGRMSLGYICETPRRGNHIIEHSIGARSFRMGAE